MKRFPLLWSLLHHALDRFRLNLAHPDALIQITLLALLTGFIVAAVVILFRLTIESFQSLLLPGNAIENYESLPLEMRIALPLIGSLFIAFCFRLLARGEYVVGVVHVMEKLAYHQGRLNLRGMMLQFLGASIAIISGHSVGREGPSIHLGAASASLVGQALGLPNNAIRTLLACGVAAAIAASFNTPLAGVIFALEVVMMEYTLASFTPIILAAVSATAMLQVVYGSDPVFLLPAVNLVSLLELPLTIITGILAGAVTTLFVYLVRLAAQNTRSQPFWLRLCEAAFITGLCALAVPQVMGIGYDTVSSTLDGDLGIFILIGIVVAKTVTTAFAVGLGVPAGLIGPTLVIGAALGATVGIMTNSLAPDAASPSGFYALLGMGAMMGATLQAPLAALIAIFELTNNPNIILPGMLAITTASLITSQVFGQRSVFLVLMKLRGLDYQHDPVLQAMRRMGVASLMDRQIKVSDQQCDRASAKKLLSQNPHWIIIDADNVAVAAMPALDLARHLTESKDKEIDLLRIPAKRLEIAPIHLQASVDEALNQLDNSDAEALHVQTSSASGKRKIYGLLTRAALQNAYRI